jgi:hypothetical protein
MNPLNDDELNSLLRQAKTKPPQPAPELRARTLAAFRAQSAPAPWWRRAWALPLGWRVGTVAVLALTLAFALSPPSTDVGQEGPTIPRRSEPRAADLTLKNLQPVDDIQPRVVRSMKDDQQ